jgi:protein-S-isoprenylcysteine O-methyltransferase Ste14
MTLLKSVLHNVSVIIVGMGVALAGTKIDSRLEIRRRPPLALVPAGGLLLVSGFLLRFWATFSFYQHRMKVISLRPQNTLITSGPYAFSRNPLYLGGNVFIFFGASLWLRSPTALLLTAAHLPFVDLFIRRQEKQLKATFNGEWMNYKNRVRRWI